MAKPDRRTRFNEYLAMDDRLITWVDVQETLFDRTNNGTQLPPELCGLQCYWDGLHLLYKNANAPKTIESWLQDVFGPAYNNTAGKSSISLISKSDESRELPIFWERVPDDDEIAPVSWLPLFRPPSRLPVSVPPHSHIQTQPTLLAFHSFKGGVGRTTHAVVACQLLLKQGAKVLLVDADLEAPGISWLLNERFPTPAISFADLLALAHGDASSNYENTVGLLTQELRKLREDNCYFLPAFRSQSQFERLEIRPENIIAGQKEPFLLSKILHEVGKTLSVDYVIVDLRAGLSEIASGFLFDSGIHRILVSTLSSQSLRGLHSVLSLIPTEKTGAGTAIIVSQIPADWMSGSGADAVEETLQPILKKLSPQDNSDSNQMPTIADFPIVRTSFCDTLTILPDSLSETIRALEKSKITQEAAALLDWLPGFTHTAPTEKTSDSSTISLDALRNSLASYASKLIFAESGHTWDFLSTTPLRNLASDNATSVPIALIVGTKGAGKTYSFLQLARRKEWADFCSRLNPSLPQELNAHILPVLSSQNLQDSAETAVSDCQKSVSKALNVSEVSDPLHNYVRDWLKLTLHEGEWRERWLDLIAWSAGHNVHQTGAGQTFPKLLQSKRQHVIACFDGLEDLFQDFQEDIRQSTAIRSLLQEVPNWLEKLPSTQLGLIVFVRQDILEAVIKQNASQLRARYAPYALRWNRTEALKLVKWTMIKAGVIESPNTDWERDTSIEALETELKLLWGSKLGRDDGKSANSGKFVTLALSDYNGRLQARDLIRFLSEAAKRSAKNTEWNDRLLVPAAIQQAVKECGRERITEIKSENPKLGAVLDKLSKLSHDLKIPATRDELKITAEDLLLLETNAVLFKDGEYYYMPEFLRQGMGLQLRGGSRPKLFSLLALRNKE